VTFFFSAAWLGRSQTLLGWAMEAGGPQEVGNANFQTYSELKITDEYEEILMTTYPL